MSLKSVNLNLLPVLRELLHSRSVTVTGRSLGRSPSAISESLAQLRETFGDPLLVRTGGGMDLTPRALDLIEPVERACAHLEGMFQTDAFDPAQADRVFVIAAHDYHVFALGPGLMQRFRAIAPGIVFRFVDLDADLGRHFASRDVDLAFLPSLHLGDLVPVGVVHEPLIEDRTVLMMRAGHPLALAEAIDAADLEKYEHVAFHPSWEAVDHRKAIAAFRRHLPVRVRIGQVTMLPYFLVGTDLVSLAPEWLAIRMGPGLGLVHRTIPYPEPVIQSVAAWSPVQHADPAHRWVREQILDWAHRASPGQAADGERHEVSGTA